MPRGRPRLTRAPKKPRVRTTEEAQAESPKVPAQDYLTILGRIASALENSGTVAAVERIAKTLETAASTRIVDLESKVAALEDNVTALAQRTTPNYDPKSADASDKLLATPVAEYRNPTVQPETPAEAAAPVANGQPKKRGRPSKAEIAAREAAARGEAPPTLPVSPSGTEAAVVAQQMDEQDARHNVGEDKPEAPKDGEVTDLWTMVDGKMVKVDPKTMKPLEELKPAPTPVVEKPAPAPAAQQTVEVPKASPAPAAEAPVPTLDEIRAVAITYAGKHGKEKLSKLLGQYGASKLSDVPESNRAALMLALQNGG